MLLFKRELPSQAACAGTNHASRINNFPPSQDEKYGARMLSCLRGKPSSFSFFRVTVRLTHPIRELDEWSIKKGALNEVLGYEEEEKQF